MSEEPRDFTMAHTHRDGIHTEFSAAEKAEKTAESVKVQIINRLLKEAPNGLAPEELCTELDVLLSTVRRRITDLWKEGQIKHHPDMLARINADKNECVVWVIGEDENRVMSKFDLLKNENIRLKKIIRIHGINPDLTQIIVDINEAAQENKS